MHSYSTRGALCDFSVEGPTMKRDFTMTYAEKKKLQSVYILFRGSGGPPPENVCIFYLPRLDFLQS